LTNPRGGGLALGLNFFGALQKYVALQQELRYAAVHK
jgi:hypothetical protein